MTYGGRVFIGGISSSVSKDDIGNEFSRFGKLRTVWVASKPPGFAFVEFEDNRDAEEAVNSLNGVSLFNENKIRVEISKKRPAPPSSGRRPFERSSAPMRPMSNESFRTGNSSSMFKPDKPKSRFLNSSSRGSRAIDESGPRYSSRDTNERYSNNSAPRYANSSPRYSGQNSRPFSNSRPPPFHNRSSGAHGDGFNSNYRSSNYRSRD